MSIIDEQELMGNNYFDFPLCLVTQYVFIQNEKKFTQQEIILFEIYRRISLSRRKKEMRVYRRDHSYWSSILGILEILIMVKN